jgi:hypothetical protein
MRRDQIKLMDKDGKEKKAETVKVKRVKVEAEAKEAERERQKVEAEAKEAGRQQALLTLKNRRQDMGDKLREAADRLSELKRKRAAMQAGFEEGDPDEQTLLLETLKLMLDVETYATAGNMIDKRRAELNPGRRYGRYKKAM